MSKLSFTYAHPSFVSSTFAAGVSIQVSFPTEGIHRVIIETRLSDTKPWSLLRSVIVNLEKVLNFSTAADGQEFRLRCADNPSDATIARLNIPSSSGSGGSGNTGGSGGSSDGSFDENTEVIQADEIETIGEIAAKDIVSSAIAAAEGTAKP